MDKKTFIKMNTAYGNNNSRKMKEITTVYVDGPTKMMGNEYVSMENIDKICRCLVGNINDVMDIADDTEYI